MQKLILTLLVVTGLYLSISAFADNTNQFQSVSTNFTMSSNAELQEEAHNVWLKLILYAALTFAGGLTIAVFAFYGAYKALGVKGVIGIAIIILFVFFMIGSILAEAF
jgi:hypothetical protein